ncbi:hypothetical protein BJ165DRAFT_418962 [Panaeolus papilionaceus]|nr:hypothetical protein BJ165DRAFT_418962 [Panaeolus papilionaceus]
MGLIASQVKGAFFDPWVLRPLALACLTLPPALPYLLCLSFVPRLSPHLRHRLHYTRRRRPTLLVHHPEHCYVYVRVKTLFTRLSRSRNSTYFSSINNSTKGSCISFNRQGSSFVSSTRKGSNFLSSGHKGIGEGKRHQKSRHR